MQIKAGFVPKHYAVTLDEAGMLATILSLAGAVRDLDVSEDTKTVLALLAQAYAGELPEWVTPILDGIYMAMAENDGDTDPRD